MHSSVSIIWKLISQHRGGKKLWTVNCSHSLDCFHPRITLRFHCSFSGGRGCRGSGMPIGIWSGTPLVPLAHPKMLAPHYGGQPRAERRAGEQSCQRQMEWRRAQKDVPFIKQHSSIPAISRISHISRIPAISHGAGRWKHGSVLSSGSPGAAIPAIPAY